ncbi:MAG: glycosyltransferase family 4 protein [Candidatus Cloacimonetes bacterium]|nr:glycosyltransferase family 4 protein [Candidatus Cloacimonadota bacterium]
MKILLIGSTYPLDSSDPQVPWLRESVRQQVLLGHQIEILAPAYRGSKSHFLDSSRVIRFRYAPAIFETLTHGSGAPSKIKSPLMKLLGIPYLISGIIYTLLLCLKTRYDVIHVHWPFPHGIMGLFAKLLNKSKLVSTCHGAELALGQNSYWIQKLLIICLALSDKVTANSSHTASRIQKLVTKPVEIIPYGATIHLPDIYSKPLEDPSVLKLLTCGRHIERKGIPYLLKAMPLILKNSPAILKITGEGNLTESWKQLAMDMGLLNTSVFFEGFVSSEKLAELYNECDIYVHPSIHDSQGDTEGLGVVLVEALAFKRPVVASAVGGIVDVIEHNVSGILIPEKDPEALAEAIQSLVGDRSFARDLGIRGQERALTYFNWENIALNTQKVYV